MEDYPVSTRRELLKLGSATAIGGLAKVTGSPAIKNCEDIEILLEEGELETTWGTQYKANVEGADTSIQIYENGEKIDEFDSGKEFILLPGEYRLKTEVNGCSYTEKVTVEN